MLAATELHARAEKNRLGDIGAERGQANAGSLLLINVPNEPFCDIEFGPAASLVRSRLVGVCFRPKADIGQKGRVTQ